MYSWLLFESWNVVTMVDIRRLTMQTHRVYLTFTLSANFSLTTHPTSLPDESSIPTNQIENY